MVDVVRVLCKIGLQRYLEYENYVILPIIPPPPMFAAEIERAAWPELTSCLRQARAQVQKTNPTPICVVKLAGIPALLVVGGSKHSETAQNRARYEFSYFSGP